MDLRKLILCVLVFSHFAMSGCTSSEEAADKSSPADAGQAAGGEFSEDEFSESGAGEAAAEAPMDEELDQAGTEPPAGGEQAPVADFGEPPAEGTADALSAEPPMQEPIAEPEVADAGTAEAVPVVDVSNESSYEEPPAPKKNYPLQKMKDVPFQSNGRTMNALYVPRKGDTMRTISSKTGVSKGNLKADNSFLARRGPKVGDKVYYESPQRPGDASTMKIYYEDQGIAPQSYVTQPGDNIRSLGKQLLGSTDSWKELWETNPQIESKGDLPEGTEIRYWPDTGGTQEMPVAEGGGGEPPPAMEPPPIEQPPADLAQGPPPPDMPPADMGAPPPPDMGAPPQDPSMGGAVGAIEPPPPPPAIEPPPPVVEPPKPRKRVNIQPAEEGLDQETTMALGAAAILIVAGGALFVIVRKNRLRKMKLGQTQV